VATFDYSDTDMTLEQIDRFCRDVEKHGQLRNVRIVGGEPLIHPQFPKIVEMLKTRLLYRQLVWNIQLSTNGDHLAEFSPQLLDSLWIRVANVKRGFKNINMAPRDTGQQRQMCDVPRKCGIALNVWGWWPCGPGHSICGLFGFGQYQRMEMPRCLEDFGLLDRDKNWELCSYCQSSAKRRVKTRDEVSKSYARAYAEHQAMSKPAWERYGE